MCTCYYLCDIISCQLLVTVSVRCLCVDANRSGLVCCEINLTKLQYMNCDDVICLRLLNETLDLTQ